MAPESDNLQFPTSRRRSAALLLCLLVLALGGCAASEQARAGRSALAAGNARAAERHFDTVLNLQPWRSEDPRFMEQVRIARRDAAVERGDEALRLRRPDAAIASYQAALEHEPEHAPAQAGLGQARAVAAQRQFQIALDHADRGEAEQVRQALREALEYQPDHPDVLAGLDSFERPDPREADLMAAGQRLAEEMRWPEAAEQFEQVRRRVPEHIQARLHLADVRPQIERTEELLVQARSHLAERQLDLALAALRQALEISPHDSQAIALHGHAQSRRAEAQRHSRAASQHLAQRQWDAAILAAQAALAVFPFDQASQKVLADARSGAAAEQNQRGAALLAEGRLGDAEAAFRDALRYQPRHPVAQRGLADAAIARADLAERDGLLGHALIWHMLAAEHVRGHSGAAALRQRIGQAHAIAPSFQIAGSGGGLTADAAEFQSELLGRLGRTVPAFIELQPVAAQEHIWRPIIDIEVADLDIRRYIAGTTSHAHTYRVEHMVPNPEVPRLRRLLREQSLEVERLRQLEQQHRVEFEATRQAAEGNEDPAVGRHLRTLRRRWEQSASRLRQAEREHNSLSGELRRAPAQVIQHSRAAWPYSVITHRVDGRAAVRITITDADGQAFGPTALVQKQFGAEDTTIDPPNPGVGLHPKSLHLPDDRSVRQNLLAPAADEAAGVIIRQLVQSQVAALQAHGETLPAPHDTELRIRAAVLLEAIDPAAGRSRLSELRADGEW